MVRLEEVEDEAFTSAQPGPFEEDNDDDYSDTDSSISTDSVPATPSETLYDRLLALRDIVPPKQRRNLAHFFHTGKSYIGTGLLWSGKSAWVLSTSLLLLGVPWALAYTEEAQYVEMEKEMRVSEGVRGDILGAGAGKAGAKPAL